MEKLVSKIYDDFDEKRKKYEAELADKEDLQEIENLEKQLKKRR